MDKYYYIRGYQNCIFKTDGKNPTVLLGKLPNEETIAANECPINYNVLMALGFQLNQSDFVCGALKISYNLKTNKFEYNGDPINNFSELMPILSAYGFSNIFNLQLLNSF